MNQHLKKFVLLLCLVNTGAVAQDGSNMGALVSSLTIGEIVIRRGGERLVLDGVSAKRENTGHVFSVRRIETRSSREELRHVPLWLDVRTNDWNEFRARLANGSGELSFIVDYRLEDSRFLLTSGDIQFGGTGLEIGDVLPGLADQINNLVGGVRFRVSGKGADAIAASLVLDDIDFSAFGISGETLAAELEFSSLLPPRTEEPQRIALDKFTIGGLAGKMHLQFQADGGKISISPLAIDIGDSSVKIHDFVYDLEASSGSGTILVDGADLAALTGELTIDGLEASGWLAGSLPFEIDHRGQASFVDGLLTATTPGVIRYRPTVAPAALAGENTGLVLARQALENFRYDGLQVRVSGDVGGNLNVGLTLKGRNPDLYGGHPLEFNLNLDGALLLLAQQASDAYQLPAMLSEKLLDLLDP